MSAARHVESSARNTDSTDPSSGLEPFELNYHLLSTAKQLTVACDDLEEWAKKYANAHRDYKRESATKFLEAATFVKTVAEREAVRDSNSEVDELRFQNYLAEGMMQASLERVRSLRGILSAFQTIANKQRAEAEFVRTGPQYDT